MRHATRMRTRAAHGVERVARDKWTAREKRKRAGQESWRRGICLMHTRHKQAECFFGRIFGVHCVNNFSLVHDGDTVRERHDFIELVGHQKHGGALVALFHNPFVNIFDAAHIETARGL